MSRRSLKQWAHIVFLFGIAAGFGCERKPCGNHAVCVDVYASPGYRCVCQLGFRISASGECVDVDECQEFAMHNLDACQPGEKCVNVLGGYKCIKLRTVLIYGGSSLEETTKSSFTTETDSSSMYVTSTYEETSPPLVTTSHKSTSRPALELEEYVYENFDDNDNKFKGYDELMFKNK